MLLSTRVHADELVGDQDERGRVTKIGRGVWEIDLGALGVLTSDKQGDTSVMRLSSDLSASVQRFVADNISVGGEVLFDYDSAGAATSRARSAARSTPRSTCASAWVRSSVPASHSECSPERVICQRPPTARSCRHHRSASSRTCGCRSPT